MRCREYSSFLLLGDDDDDDDSDDNDYFGWWRGVAARMVGWMDGWMMLCSAMCCRSITIVSHQISDA
jgi:hypothetical protein